MTIKEFCLKLIHAELPSEVERALEEFSGENEVTWTPLGRDNNRGTVDAASDPVRSAVERITNAIDAVLESEHTSHHGKPDCRTPFEAAHSWLGVPEEGGLAAMSTLGRRNLAKRVTVTLKDGYGKDGRLLSVRDNGTGIRPERMRGTILSLNETNKIQKFYLSGAYGQGGSSTFAFCDYAVIASREQGSEVGVTVVKYEDLDPEHFKIGRYVYLTDQANQILKYAIPEEDFPAGTLINHIGFDLHNYTSPLGPNSLYGSLNANLFDPVIPVWLDSRVHDYRRVIKGSRNALNGARDEGDADRSATISHKMPIFNVSLGDFGVIGIEYWVLSPPEKSNKKPSAAFVNPVRPIILTLNGQNHGEFSGTLIRKNAQLPFLSQRLICHIKCDSLSAAGKRQLFVSNREGGRNVQVQELIQGELLKAFASDDELARLNDEARRQGTEEIDETAKQRMRAEVAKILKMDGITISGIRWEGSGNEAGSTTDKPRSPRPPRPKPTPLQISEPPTYIRLVWEETRPITFFPGERRYIRIETDANKTYYSAEPAKSRLNFILPPGLHSRGTTELVGGRMRLVVEAEGELEIGLRGRIDVELMRVGLPTLSDSRETEIVAKPIKKSGGNTLTLPMFEVVPVHGPDDLKWSELGWPEDISAIASEGDLSDGTLTVYYSDVFPDFTSASDKIRSRDEAASASFVRRYETWLAAHSLLLHRDQTAATAPPSHLIEPEQREVEVEVERAERRRMASLAVVMAAREIRDLNSAGEDSE